MKAEPTADSDRTGTGRPRVLLLLDAAGDRRVLKGWLSQTHDVIETGHEDSLASDFDLCVIDDGAFARSWMRIAERKRDSEPVFLPFVLLTSARTAPLVAEFPTHDIDEVLEAPIAPEVIVSRVDVLLDRRMREKRLAAARDEAMDQLRAAQQDAQQELETTTLLLDVGRALTSHNEVDEILHAFADALHHVMPYKRIAVMRYDETRMEMTVVYSEGQAAYPKGSVFPHESLSAPAREAMKERRVRVVDYDRLSDKEAGAARDTGGRLSVVMPLVLADRVIGMVVLDSPNERMAVTERGVRVAEGIGSQAAAVIDNARRYEAQHDIADRLQEALLTLPDRLPGIEFAHAYHSATEAACVGGDFYDLFEIEHDFIGITIGDVAGKGLDAALLTSLVKNAIRVHAMEKGASPAAILELTNGIIFKSTPTDMFVTVLFAVLDCRDGCTVYSSAGHPVGALVREDGTAYKMPPTGPLLGAFPASRFGQADVWLDIDELLFLYTDGLIEARRGSEMYTEERLFDLLTAKKDGHPAETVAEVIADVNEFTGHRLRDDLAILAVKRLGRKEETLFQQKLQM